MAASRRGGVTVRKLFDDHRREWHLRIASPLADHAWNRSITVFDVNRPGLALAGYFGYFAWSRVQVLGKTELTFLRTLSPRRAREIVKRIFGYGVPCVVVTRNLPVPPVVRQCARETSTPVLRTSMMTTRFMNVLTTYLEDTLAPSTTVHATLVDVYGIGVLIMGKSGIGKSECALSLVKRGHRFVADDAVRMRRSAEAVLTGTHDRHLGFRMELRGIGIIDVKDLFGTASVREDKQIQLVAVLEEWRSGGRYDRIGLREYSHRMLGVKIPRVIIPVRPGRDAALIVEVAASNTRAKLMGVFSAREFDEQVTHLLERRP